MPDFYVSAMFAAGSNQPLSLAVIRHRDNGDGTIHTELDHGYLAHLFADATQLPHDGLLVGADGEILGGMEHGGALSSSSPNEPLLQHILAQPGGSSFSGQSVFGPRNERRYAYERIPGYAAWVAVAVDQDAILRRWYFDLAEYGAAAAVWSAALLIASWLIIRHARAELAAHEQDLGRQTAERERTEGMLRQSRKLEAMGQLTGGVAHDFNNLLSVIIVNAEFLLEAMEDREALADQARDILNSALSGAELTRRLLIVAREQELQPRPLDLNALLPGLVAMLRRTLGDLIQINTTLAPDLWLTLADASQVSDVVLNLALNARDAMPDGGDLTIATFNTQFDARIANASSDTGDDDYVVLSVADTGTGMPPDIVERATEPFFTTKPPASGSGLGLSMAYGFARQSGGHLVIESQVGIGTTIRLYLPRARDNAGSAADTNDARGEERDGLGGDELILLVDDNPTLRSLVQRRLIVLGYRVTLAADGPSALAIIRSPEPIDLLLTDVAMPGGMSGYELAEAARGQRTNLKVLFMTGYAGAVATGRDAPMHPGPVLRKPFRQQDLGKAVRAALDSDATSV